ncbi:hypothetical protein L6164_036297 [Bauhinia variegata]|uniref:Uncharacterized protein n=1 Tax=Bauhinia variegata TaxID=167791 RepID=A0ACB9KGN3_BAUVA|nr:hypothetical protein L6164_036297 [Bauhinia variegata]
MATKMDAEDKSQNVNFYKLLSLSPKTATMDEIKRAHRSMALPYHPDVCHEGGIDEDVCAAQCSLQETVGFSSSRSL